MKVESRNDLIDAIIGLIQPKPDGQTKAPENPAEKIKR
jgi:hypothetical protein